MKRRTPRTLSEVAAANLRTSGLSTIKSTVKGAEACSIVLAWAIAARELGAWPTVEAYSAHWKQTERTSYYELALFRQAFPTEHTPQRLADALNATVDGWVDHVGAVLSAPAALLPALAA